METLVWLSTPRPIYGAIIFRLYLIAHFLSKLNSSSFPSLFLSLSNLNSKENGHSYLHRYYSCHHPSTSWCLPQIWLQRKYKIKPSISSSFFRCYFSLLNYYLLDGFVVLQVEFWICLILTILGYLPGIIYAIYAITK